MVFELGFGNGSWCAQNPLKELYLDLFTYSVNKEASVSNLLITIYHASGEGMSWNVSFYRLLHDWELDSGTSIFTLWREGVFNWE